MIHIAHWDHWHASLALARETARRVKRQQGRVCHISLGSTPFPEARLHAGYRNPQIKFDGRASFHELDLSRQELPWHTNSIGFIYCRNVLNMLDDPAWLLSEIARVARAGWIEGPSPIVEFCRGVEPGRAQWRGRADSRWVMWDGDYDPHGMKANFAGVKQQHQVRPLKGSSRLFLVAKYPKVEWEDLGRLDEEDSHEQQARLIDAQLSMADDGALAAGCDVPCNERLLNDGPLHWHTYHAWDGMLQWKMLTAGEDYDLMREHTAVMKRACWESLESGERWRRLMEAQPIPNDTLAQMVKLAGRAAKPEDDPVHLLPGEPTRNGKAG